MASAVAASVSRTAREASRYRSVKGSRISLLSIIIVQNVRKWPAGTRSGPSSGRAAAFPAAPRALGGPARAPESVHATQGRRARRWPAFVRDLLAEVELRLAPRREGRRETHSPHLQNHRCLAPPRPARGASGPGAGFSARIATIVCAAEELPHLSPILLQRNSKRSLHI